MIKLFIKDIKAGDVLLNHKFALRTFTKKFGKVGNEFYAVDFSDKTGGVQGKIWQNNFANCNFTDCKIGDVVEITGKVDSFNDKLQIIVEKLNKTTNFDPADFVNEGKRNLEELWNYILSEVNSLEDTEIKNVILKIFDDATIVPILKKVPAAETVHHNFVGGLLEHTYEMLLMAKKCKEIYTDISYDELFFGTLFHDIGKVMEYNITGVSLERTKEGYLI
ncbi:hypothetical protein KA001_00660, partial [Patescibacteria group bacterium]|nr:hypothetical protein [Patescibacteria group bacterium]